jgi:DNA-binding beta-propeller fold protein YncE
MFGGLVTRKRISRNSALAALLLSAAACGALASTAVANDVYVFNYNGGGSGSASQYSIGSGGPLAPLSPSSALIGGGPLFGTVSINGDYLYVTGSVLEQKKGEADGQVSTLAINPDGTLMPLGAWPLATNTNPSGIADDPSNGLVYVAEEESNQIAILQSTANGTLEAASAGPTDTGSATNPLALAVTPNGQSLLVANSGNGTVSDYTIAGDGSLTANGIPVAAGTSAASDPDSIVLAPDGAFAYVADGGDGTISEYSISSSGALAPLITSPTIKTDPGPDSIVMTPNGEYVYAANTDGNDITGYYVEPDGVLSKVGGPTTLTAQPESLAIAPDGGYLYVTNGSGTVSGFQIGATGALTAVAGAGQPPATGDEPGGIVVTPDTGPTAAFSDGVGASGSPSTFNGSNSTAGSTPVGSYGWQFGDGSSGTGETASHTYTSPGTYTVTLTVTGSDSCSLAPPFTGVTPFCIADPAASVSHQVTVPFGTAVSSLSALGSGGPTVKITTPKAGANYIQNATVLANYSCADGLNAPGLLTGGLGCLGNVAAGEPIDTIPGKHTFTATATSEDGQKATKSVTYTSNGWLEANKVLADGGPLHGYNCPGHIAATFYLTASTSGKTSIAASAGGAKIASETVTLKVKKRTLIVLCLSSQGLQYAADGGASPWPLSADMYAATTPYGGSTRLHIHFTVR